MNWKRSLGQAFATIVAVLLLIHLLYSGRLAKIELRQEDISTQFGYLEGRLEKLEKQISDIGRSLEPADTTTSVPPDRPADHDTSYLEQRIRGIEQAIDDLYRRETVQTDEAGVVPLPSKPLDPSASGNWLASLPREKQTMVRDLFHEQLVFVENEVSTATGDFPPDPEDMHAILMESREQLESKLRQILSEEEYQTFLDAASVPFSPR